MEDNASAGRRDFLRVTGALVGVAASSSLAGCGDLLESAGLSNDGNGGSGSSENRSDYVPSGANGVGYIDVDALLADSQLRSGINDAVSSYAQQSGTDQQAPTVEQMLDSAQEQSRLDPRKINEVLGFYTGNSGSGADAGAVVLWSDWSESTLRQKLNAAGSSVSTESDGDTTLYFPQSGGPLAALGDGTFAVGSEAAVRSVVDLQNGNGSSLSGDLADVFATTHGMGRYAATVPDDAVSRTETQQMNLQTLNQVNYITTSVYKSGSQRGQDVTMLTGSQQAASEVTNVLSAGRQLALQRLMQMQSESTQLRPSAAFAMQSARSYLEDATISTADANVTVSYTAPPAEFARSNVLVFALFGLVVNTAGFLQSRAEETDENSREQPASRIQVVSTTGEHISDGSIGSVSMVIKSAPGSNDIDLSNATVAWVDNSGLYELASVGTGAGDAQYAVEPVKDQSGASPVLDSPTDRFVLKFDLGTDDLPNATAFGQRLPEGAEASVRLRTQAGAETEARLLVPESLSGQQAVRL